MYEEHPKLSTPDDSQVIWRYFDLSGFLSLMSQKCLYFCRCDKFDDKWDSKYSALPQLLEEYPPDDPKNLEILRSHIDQKEFIRSTTFANCWHMSDGESAAMWEIYTARNNGIAISSTIGRLKEAFRSCGRRIWISKMIYGDFALPDLADHNNALPPLFVKRKEYEFEKEVRALVWDKLSLPGTLNPDEPAIHDRDTGFLCPIDVKALVQSVVIAPKLRSSMLGIVQSIFDQFGMEQIKVTHSRLAEVPIDLDDRDPRIFTLTMRMDWAAIEMLLKAWKLYEQSLVHDRRLYEAAFQVQLALRSAIGEAGYVPLDRQQTDK